MSKKLTLGDFVDFCIIELKSEGSVLRRCDSAIVSLIMGPGEYAGFVWVDIYDRLNGFVFRDPYVKEEDLRDVLIKNLSIDVRYGVDHD